MTEPEVLTDDQIEQRFKENAMAREPDRLDLGDDGSMRKSHYGAGRQPWDDLVDQGWGPAFAAGNVLKYLRRAKDREESLEKARWYYDRLIYHAASEVGGPWTDAFTRLKELLTTEELKMVRVMP